MPINRSCKKVSNYVKKFLMRPCKKVEIGEYLASEKFSTARIHFSIFQKLHSFLIGICHSVLIASGLQQIFINLINFQGDNHWKMLLDNTADL